MENPIKWLIFHNWQQKCVAFSVALVTWVLVNQSITATKTFINVPVRIVNLPPHKTVVNLLPNGRLSTGIKLSLKGKKEAMNQLEADDLEVLIDASYHDEEWVEEITKKHLTCYNPEVDLSNDLYKISYQEILIKVRQMITVKVPVIVSPPLGEPPSGYKFLDVWPRRLLHTVSGPEKKLRELQSKGIDLVFDLDNITKKELDLIDHDKDQVSFLVPDAWKQVMMPYLDGVWEEVNDPAASELRIDFLRKDLLPVERKIPVRVFYPLKEIEFVNPMTFPLKENPFVRFDNGSFVYTEQLQAHGVGRLFLEIVRDHLEIVVVAKIKQSQTVLDWSVQFINPSRLEEIYVTALMPANTTLSQRPALSPRKYENYLRTRFRKYLQAFKFYTMENTPLMLQPVVQDREIVLYSSKS